MNKSYRTIKTLILVLASALTLVAVTFAWFSLSKEGLLPMITKKVTGGLVNITFQQTLDDTTYQTLTGDIDLSDCTAGQFNKYRLIITTNTADKIKLNFSIDDLPTDLPQALKDSVKIKYTLKKASKSVGSDGKTVYTDGDTILASTGIDGYVSLSEITDSTVFNVDISSYQTAVGDCFILYYEIGLGQDSPSTIQNKSAELGSVNIVAQLVG